MTEVGERIEQLVTSYLPGVVVFAAAELGVFDRMATPIAIGDLARQLEATEDGVTRLCRALAVLGFVELEGERVRALPGVVEAFASMRSLVRFHHHQVLPPMLHLADAVRSGRPQHAAWPFARPPVAETSYGELARHPAEVRALVEAMDHDSRGVGAAIAKAVDLSAARVLVDIGCGGGVVARELLAALPALHIHGIDSTVACEVARERSVAAGLADRHTLTPGDARTPLSVREADVAMLSAILADFPRDERLTLLTNARDALRPGGLLLVSETLLDDDRRGPPRAAMLSLFLLAATAGDQLSFAQLREELVEAGFAAPTVERGTPRDLVIATRP